MAIEIDLRRSGVRSITARNDQGQRLGSMHYFLDSDKQVWELNRITSREGAGIDLFRAFVQDIGSGARVHANIVNIKTINSVAGQIDGDFSIQNPIRLSVEQSMRIPMIRGASILGLLMDDVLVYPGYMELFGHTK